jgi:hypothetical protein
VYSFASIDAHSPKPYVRRHGGRKADGPQGNLGVGTRLLPDIAKRADARVRRSAA